jgi:N-acetylglucosaminyldiphosphoundecaprenol N-acetyl-beta-D-mannosaminyltransferase
VGSYSPPFHPRFSDSEYEGIISRISQSGANIVWVGLGTPKQDIVAQRIANLIPVVTVSVGAAFDFFAGRKAEAPAWLQGTGLEWAFRLKEEPRRLLSRYTLGSCTFLKNSLFPPPPPPARVGATR